VSYGSSSLVATTQLAQTTLRSVIGRMELDRTSRSATTSTASSWRRSIWRGNWGVKVLRYESGPHAAQGNPARDAGDHRGREKRAVIATWKEAAGQITSRTRAPLRREVRR
jgi:hypothetical protein